MKELQNKENILNWYTSLIEMHLHPGKENVTLLQISESKIKKGDNVLEVGFGVGETICKLAQEYKDSSFYGIEINPIMLFENKKKTRKLGLTNISIHLLEKMKNCNFQILFSLGKEDIIITLESRAWKFRYK